PCRERNGVIWVYMGPESPAPELPEIEWNMVPAENVHLSKRVATNNWVQALEGEIDSSHAGFLHSRRDRESRQVSIDRSPRFETIDTEYGVAIAARRDAGPDTYYWRINQFLLPFYTLVPPEGRVQTISGHAWVPIDDTNTLCFMFTYHPTNVMDPKWRDILSRGRNGREPGHLSIDGALPATSAAHGAFRPKANWSNDFGLDRSVEDVYYSGLGGLWPQDSGCQESMGAIYDRTKERLGSSDTGIIQMRRSLLRAVRALREAGVSPAGAQDPSVFKIRSISIESPRTESWLDGAFKHRVAEGVYGYTIPT
ncbi:MAG: ring-hydroxylating oxygenase subunit alpha, partial [Chloroflexota bacterium]